MPWLTSCCCGFSVKSGTKAVAILSLVYSVFGLLAVGTYNYGKEMLHRESLGINQHRRPTGYLEIQNRPSDEKGDETSDLKPDDKLDKMKRVEELMTLYAVSVSVNFLVSLSLLLGVKLEKKLLLVPWVVWTALNLVISQAVVLYAPDRTTSTIPDIFSTAIMVYCMLCVISYYQVLSDPPPHPATLLLDETENTYPTSFSADRDCGSFPSCQSIHPPRSPPLRVALPPTPPPAYSSDNPPIYDPPPPYPGTPEEKTVMDGFEAEEILEVNTEADPELGPARVNLDPEQGLIRISEQETETVAPLNQVPEKN